MAQESRGVLLLPLLVAMPPKTKLYYAKACPLDPECCSKDSWKKRTWGETQEEVEKGVKTHLWNKHNIADSVMESYIQNIDLDFYWDYNVEPASAPSAPSASKVASVPPKSKATGCKPAPAKATGANPAPKVLQTIKKGSLSRRRPLLVSRQRSGPPRRSRMMPRIWTTIPTSRPWRKPRRLRPTPEMPFSS